MFRPEMMTSPLKRSDAAQKATVRTVDACKRTLGDIPQRLKSRRRKSRVSVQLVIA